MFGGTFSIHGNWKEVQKDAKVVKESFRKCDLWENPQTAKREGKKSNGCTSSISSSAYISWNNGWHVLSCFWPRRKTSRTATFLFPVFRRQVNHVVVPFSWRFKATAASILVGAVWFWVCLKCCETQLKRGPLFYSRLTGYKKVQASEQVHLQSQKSAHFSSCISTGAAVLLTPLSRKRLLCVTGFERKRFQLSFSQIFKGVHKRKRTSWITWFVFFCFGLFSSFLL